MALARTFRIPPPIRFFLEGTLVEQQGVGLVSLGVGIVPQCGSLVLIVCNS